MRTLITQVLCTNPGERINRPRFGAGVAHMLFAPLGPEVASAAQLMIQSSLQQWLADLVDVTDVSVEVHDSSISVTVTWSRRSQDTSQTTVVRVARP
ncbi:GPW/gp25 family protein [Arthrobacter sp. B0490]|uniref:GPW/gp25 family protein n=1 Tax=Arthrobacter sp. B0490 TaxID=2058891 RepID=UPI001C6791EA|nr:GPW/gp25 family protein [Arthrobacter sp. B0490]